MKLFLTLIFLGAAFTAPLLKAQATTAVPFGTVRSVGSSHDTTSDGIQSWNAVSLLSPSGQWYSEDTHNGLDRPDGSSSVPVVLSEVGTWEVWFASGYDAPQAGSTFSSISEYLSVQPVTPPEPYFLTTAAGTGGSVSSGGAFAAGSVVSVTATPDPAHDFAGWSGDAAGTGNPVSVTLDGNKAVQANFTLKTFALTTSASAGGSVTPGGTYPAGTTVTIAASPDATHRFLGWSGDASGTASPVAITLDRAKSAQALFTGKASQTITFNPPGDHGNGAAPFGLSATASSGLAVTFTVVSGPATISNSMVQVTGPGTVSIRANQTGDGSFLAAAPVTQSFNVIAAVALKYRGSVRPLLKSKRTPAGAPFVIQLP